MGEVQDASVTLSNSIIGVAILAMPYCYAQCGFILATALLLLAGLGTAQSCQMLLKSALATKKRSYEFLAHHVYGPVGKLTVELSLIGLSIGTLVAFFVIIGDLCPQVLASLLREPALAELPACRAVVMATIGVCVILPLSLMRDPSALSRISAVSLLFYVVFMLHLSSLALFGVGAARPDDGGVGAAAAAEFRFFRVDGLLYCLPIFGLAFSCQTQLFLMCDSLSDPSIKVIRRILHLSVFGCCAFYILIGTLGYVAFNSAFPIIHGDLMTMYPGTFMSDLIKLGFVLSVAVSFPLIAFPCRVSVYSFVYLQHHRSSGTSDLTSGHVFIPDAQFRAITSAIVLGTLVGGLLIPNVEFILGLTGAVTGSVICYILPAGIHLNAFSGSGSGRCVARAIKWLGVLTLCVGTAATLMGQQPQQGGHESLPLPRHLVKAKLAPPVVVAAGPVHPMKKIKPPDLIIGPPTAADAEMKDSDSRKEPPLPDIVNNNNNNKNKNNKEAHSSKGKMKERPRLPSLKTITSKSTPASLTSTSSTLRPSSTSASPKSTSTLAESNATTTIAASQAAKAATTAAASADDLEVLAQLLREQREQGRRIEAQLRRMEGGLRRKPPLGPVSNATGDRPAAVNTSAVSTPTVGASSAPAATVINSPTIIGEAVNASAVHSPASALATMSSPASAFPARAASGGALRAANVTSGSGLR